MKDCQTVGCGSLGVAHPSVKCKICERSIYRCRACWAKFEKLQLCANCTENDRRPSARAPLPRHDDERDIDANGWLSNAKRFLEELE